MSEKTNHITTSAKDAYNSERTSKIHWRVPAIMGSSFFGGLLCMAAHHAMYILIEGQSASNSDVQLWVIRAGTALAFISKVLLAVATGVAYDQWMWLDLHSKPHAIESLDSMFAVIGNALEFLNLRLWFRRPALTFLAAVTWLLPISAIITPGTLSIQSVQQTSNGTLSVPERAYTTESAVYCGTTTTGNLTSYAGLATGLLNPTFATVLANDVLSVQSSATNLTYDLQFFGPALSCVNSSQADLERATRAIQEYEISTGVRVAYYGWVPQTSWGPDVNGSFFASPGVQVGSIRLDVVSRDTARVYIYLNSTGITDTGKRTNFQSLPTPQMMTCTLYNASYDARFEVDSTGNQRITASKVFQNWMVAHGEMDGPLSDVNIRVQMNMQAVMDVFGMMVIGSIEIPNDASAPITNNVYASGMNTAMYPARQDLTQKEMTDRMIMQNEALFQNITLSMRYGIVAGNSGTDFASTTTISAFHEPQFVYEPRTLLISYGLSTFFAFLCVLMGAHALFQNGASYTTSFSTIVRVTRDPALTRLIADEGDLQGAEPVPGHIRHAEIHLGRSAKATPSYSSSWL